MIPIRRLLAAALLAAAHAGASPLADLRDDDPTIVNGEAFQRSHPDLLWRNRGIFEYQRQRYADAARYFRDAAYYGDKPAQAMLAMMSWNGEGADTDRAQAYAWIDLAAERGYESLVATREKFWAALDEIERRRALDLGKDLYAKYGDEHARDRLEREIVRAKNQLTGSHLGRAGTIAVLLPGPDGRMRPVDGSLFYSSRYWDPKKYRDWQDQRWELPQGHVEVGPVQQAAEPDPGR
ncbi:hypothetical protein [Dokdonella sp.]|uniref:hypothetical protein n=1 Tax=Dokdonella sp. TaxID=2291710 RepID=UPI001B21D5F4|nr:hypothetical protein [Dokdonella sp.]MBO9661322.1 sel1 repeat family protein [Dokdonella sp.]